MRAASQTMFFVAIHFHACLHVLLDNLSVFKDLKALGIRLAIDDFGTGYSSFASLKHLNVDRLKIDKYFVDDMTTDGTSLTLISSMIDMGNKLGYEITAEGVETSEQFLALKQLACKNVQGYLFSKPVNAYEISILLNQQKTLKLTG